MGNGANFLTSQQLCSKLLNRRGNIMSKEKNFKVELMDICGIAWEEKDPSDEEIRETIILDLKPKIELRGIDSWIRESLIGIKKTK
jgi:hypothetical protein